MTGPLPTPTAPGGPGFRERRAEGLENTLRRLTHVLNLRSSGRMMVHSILVGVVAGCGALLFQTILELCLHYMLDMGAGFHPPPTAGEPPLHAPTSTLYSPLWLVLIPTLGGLVSGWLVYTFAPSAEGHGTDAAIEALHRGDGHIPARVPFVKTLASSLTLGSGGSGGREGPIAQIGAGFGSYLSRKMKLSTRETRVLVAAGMGAGIGAIFRAPLAGALFAAEVLYLDTEFENEFLVPATIASITSYSLYSSVFGWNPLFETPAFSFTHPLELFSYAVLGVLCALMGYLYIRTFYFIHDYFKGMSLPRVLRPALGGLLMGMVGVLLPEEVRLGAVSMGYGSIQLALLGKLGALTLLGIAVTKIVTTSLSIGSGGSGGIFGPSMVIGGCFGGAVGLGLFQISPALVQNPQSFVLVGMAGFFAGAAKTPISTLIMVSEMTGNYQLLVPAMLTSTIAFQLLPRWTLYHCQVRNKGASPAHLHEFEVDVLEELRVSECMVQDVKTIREDTPFRQIVDMLVSRSHSNFPVLSMEGALVGVLCLRDIREFTLESALADVAVAGDLMSSEVATVRPDDTLHEAMYKVGFKNVELLVVVKPDDPTHVLGVLTRGNIVSAYNRELRRRRLEAGEDSESRLG